MEQKYLVIGAVAALAIAGVVYAGTSTEKSGNSTSTITQEGGGTMRREVTKTPDGQTIIQESGGSKATVVQRNTSGKDCTDKSATKTADGKDAKDSKAAADDGCKQITEPKDMGPGFDRTQALKDKMDAMRRQ